MCRKQINLFSVERGLFDNVFVSRCDFRRASFKQILDEQKQILLYNHSNDQAELIM